MNKNKYTDRVLKTYLKGGFIYSALSIAAQLKVDIRKYQKELIEGYVHYKNNVLFFREAQEQTIKTYIKYINQDTIKKNTKLFIELL